MKSQVKKSENPEDALAAHMIPDLRQDSNEYDYDTKNSWDDSHQDSNSEQQKKVNALNIALSKERGNISSVADPVSLS